MRLFKQLICGAVALAALPLQSLRAETRVYVVYGNLGQGDDNARGRLQQRLQSFANDVKIRAAQLHVPPVALQFQVLPLRALNQDAAQVVDETTRSLWNGRPDSVAFVWGRIDSGDRGETLPTGTIFIGLARAEGILPAPVRPVLFGPVLGTISGGRDQLNAYEVIIGYALLRRVWREGRYQLMEPIADVLKGRIAVARHSQSSGSWAICVTSIERSIRPLLAAPRPPGDPPANVPVPEPVSCS